MPNGKVKNPNSSVGFSLGELTLALVCASVILTAALPGIVRLQNEWTLLGAARIVESSLQWGKMQAISSNAPVIFEVDAVRQEFHWTDGISGQPFSGSIRHLPKGVRIVASPRRSLRFYQHGNAAPAGTYTVGGEAGSYSVVVTPGGRIRVQRN